LVGFLVTLLAIPKIIEFTKKHKLMDDPTLDKEQRKMHKDPIPTLGGVGIFIGFIVSTGLWLILSYFKLIPSFNISLIPEEDIWLIGSIAVSLLILFVTGIFDDLTDLRASLKFLIQIGTAILVAYHGLKIESLNGVLGINEIPFYFQYAFSVFLIVGLTNAFNLIDGIDGLAGGLSFMNAMVLGIILLFIRHDIAFSLIAFGFAGALLGFLKHNFNPARIFMGDTGSLIIGFLMAVLGIIVIQGSETSVSIDKKDVTGLTIIVVGILLLPVYDTLRVFAERILKKSSPFKPDKTHVHHLLIETGSNHKKAAIILYVANAIIILMAYLLKDVNPAIAVPFLFVLAAILSESINLKRWTIAMAKGKQAEKESEKLSDENRYLNRDSQDFDL
jgi:UDP-N-acetylmuramyl pentapeptide phosphotransferase/UDP-N-acetylglucosamine-1-phosphate transferase